jgi:MFS family permease
MTLARRALAGEATARRQMAPGSPRVNESRSKIFYGWYVAMACGVGLACGIACVVTYTFSIFLGPLRQEFGWSQTDVFLGLTISVITVALAAPVLGTLIDRVGPRRMILSSIVLQALMIASFSQQTEALWTFYARFVLQTILALGTTHVAFTRVIALWFDRKRGLALGLALAGLGVGGFIWPPYVQWLIEAFGWRMAYVALAGTIFVVSFPVIALVVRNTPQSMGLQPDGDPTPPVGTAPAGLPPGLTVAEALRSGTFWTMLVAFLLIGLSITSVQLSLVPLLVSRGVTPMLAATALSTVALALIFGRVAAGWLMDRFFAPRVAIAFLAGPIVAILLLAAGATGPLAFVAGLLTGLAAGAEVDVTAFLTSRYFGLRYFSSIYAWYYGAYSLGAGLGPFLTAGAVERLGGYTGVLYAHAVLLAISALLLARLGPFPRWEARPA